ncbi:peptidylprolyl isomerase [Desulfocicer vacuolatum DSM 3385]|uniref:Peptidyl-prolyl cis-trans isomerase n=1 Tax=Desulfocicer vacuolatum DSM 3385 TaxID=1121400 RepID=A0A1W2EEK2_9BACT|nr:peptidylprolyl isomerase [Desulfocicer vacuolatum]SMD08105.1 peptidylprolyl isomerase [Desulfocicer vacuolatum DSM 3385]
MTDTIKSGDTIRVAYTGKFENGEIFDTSEGREGLKFTVGTGQLIKGFDQAVVGMAVGDKKSVTIPPEDGYGLRDENRIIEIPAESVPEEMTLEVGMQLQLTDPNGNPAMATVAEVGEKAIKMDVNHFLAGKTLVFDIEIEEMGLEPDVQQCGTGCDSGCDTDKGCGCDCGCGD